MQVVLLASQNFPQHLIFGLYYDNCFLLNSVCMQKTDDSAKTFRGGCQWQPYLGP